MKKLWSIPVLSVYFYAITILTQYGYNAYFNIPANFIEASIKANIIYFFQLFELAQGIAGLLKWWMWTILILAVVIVAFLCFSHYLWQKLFAVVAVIFLVGSLCMAPKFGGLIASSTSTFLVPETGCIEAPPDQVYIVPVIYEAQAILVPVDTNTKKLTDSFLVKDISSLSCKLQDQYIGKISK